MFNSIFRPLIASALSMLCAAQAFSQCGAQWASGPNAHVDPNPNGEVLAMISWDPDGTGPASPLLVIGGTFTSVGGVAAKHIAAFNGFHWSQLGAGFNNTVHALGIFNSQLIAGGDFTDAGNHIARFNGATWTNMGMGTSGGGLSGRVSALTVFNNDLIVGGSFTIAGGFVTSCIARWNGSIWGAMGSGSGMSMTNNSPRVQCLAVYQGELFAGGFFDSVSGVSASNIARWNGSSWSKLGFSGFSGDGANGLVRSFLVHDFGTTSGGGEQLVVGGSFTSVSSGLATINSPAVARWNGAGTLWHGLGAGLSGATVGGLANDGSGFIAGGFFPGPFGSLARWDDLGSAWQAFDGGGISFGSVQSVVNYTQPFATGYTTVIGGAFQGAGGEPLNNLARVTFPDFRPIQFVFEPFAFATLGSRLIAAGYGSQPSSQGFPPFSDNIMAWDGVRLSPLGLGLNGYANAMAARADSPTINTLAVGGWFSMAGGNPSNHVALWTENSGAAIYAWSPMGAGFNNEVYSMGVFRSKFVAGGAFTASGATAVNGVARFDGTAWTPLTSGLGNTSGVGKAFAFTTRTAGTFSNPQHQLIIGGRFINAGGLAAKNVAAWFENEVNHPLSGWLTFGSGFDGDVLALTMHSGGLFAGGRFTHSGDGATVLNRVARWTGTSWVQVGNGFTVDVIALRSLNGSLYALIHGTSTQLAKWDGTNWITISGGVQSADGSSNVYALGEIHGELHVGGVFDTVNPGTLDSPNWARYIESGAPWVAQQPLSQSVGCGENASLTAQAAPDYSGLNYEWQKDGAPLSNGRTGHGSSISGANAATLTVTNIHPADIGSYRCVLSNSCGSDVSTAATFTLNNGSSCCHADISGDDVVNIDDLVLLITSWGACPAPPAACNADIAPPGGDDLVNIDDLVALVTAWGGCP